MGAGGTPHPVPRWRVGRQRPARGAERCPETGVRRLPLTGAGGRGRAHPGPDSQSGPGFPAHRQGAQARGARVRKAAAKAKAKAYSTRYSQAVSHPSTNQARPCLASEIRRDRARSGWYGRRRWRPRPGALRARAGLAGPSQPGAGRPVERGRAPPGDPGPRSLPPGPQRTWAASTDWRRAPGPGAGCPAWRGRAGGPSPTGEPEDEDQDEDGGLRGWGGPRAS